MQGRAVQKRGENLRKHWAAAALAGAVAVGTTCASAGTYTWVGGNPGDPTIYNEAANWNLNLVPGSSDVAFFDAGANNQTPTLNASTSVGELDFNTAGWTLGGSPNVLTLNGVGGVGILSSASSGTNEIGVGLDIAAAQTWQVATGGTLQVDGAITDSNALTLGAAGYGGTVILTNSGNTYSGALTLAAGTLQINSGASLSNLSSLLGKPAGGNGALNVYGTVGTTGQARWGADAAGSDVMTIYSGGAANVNTIVLGDNSGSSPVQGILGAIHLQGGGTLNVPSSNGTTTGVTSAANAGIMGIGVFSVGSAGTGTPSFTGNHVSADTGVNNDFGYVSVPTNASIGAPSGGTANAPGQIDIGGSYRSTVGSPGTLPTNLKYPISSTIGGGNGLMDVNGGVVNINAYLNLAISTTNQQFAALNILNGGSVTVNSYGRSNTASYFTGSTNVEMSTGPYGSYSVINVVGGTLNNGTSATGANPNNAINLAGPSNAYSSNNNALVYGLPTGILTIGPSGLVQTGYVQARPITFNTTPNSAGSTTNDFSGEPSGFVNFNGGTLQTNTTNSSNQTGMIAQTVAGVYVYGGGAVLSGGGATGGSQTMLVGFFAPPGAGVPTQTLTVANGGITNPGSGYVTPPIVEIEDATGFDAAGYATINLSGQLTSIVITNPGFNLSSPTITLVGGVGAGGTPAAASLPARVANTSGGLTVKGGAATFNLQGSFAATNGNGGGGGTLLSDNVTSGQELFSFTSGGTVATAGTGLGNNPYAAGTYYGANYSGIRNNTSTYMGPTVIETGALQLTTAASAATSATGNTSGSLFKAGAFPALNNNIPFSSVIVVGDTGPGMSQNDSAAVLNISSVAGAGGFELAPGLVNSTAYNSTNGQAPASAYTSTPQVLAGFGTVKGSSTAGLTVGLASGGVTGTASSSTTLTSTGNNFGGYPYAATGTFTSAPTVNNSTVSPGYTANGSVVPMGQSLYVQDNIYGPIVIGTTTSAPAAFSFNTQQGNAKTQKDSSAVGTLALGGNNSMPTTFGPGGVYYWKLDLTNGGAGATSTPGVVNSASVPYIGTAWDNLLIDNLGVTSTSSNAFTIQAVSFNSTISGGTQIPVSGGIMPPANYSWVVAQVRTTAGLANLLGNLSLNTSGLPTPASGYQYFLNAQPDPSAGMSDLVVNYAPVPEPTGLALLGMGAGAMMVRRRRRVGAAA